ncbi:MAG: DUF302 domain-containing protein [Chromatiaceae bacterium]|jgi:uncharacterized protein (DUF302 family)|nr:DUF302 domain-containing protein [Chromatiaceae bacterium]
MYVFGVVIEAPFEAALARVTEAIAAEKLGIVSDVDVGAILRAKLGKEIGGYRILGACAPGLAKRVIAAQPAAGVLLPCSLVVRRLDDASTAVDFMNPQTLLALAGVPEIDDVGAEAKTILERVRDRLTS